MFDKTTIYPGPTNSSVTVHEHRAPTDESIRLLRELEQKANENVLKSTRVDNNSFTAVLHQMRDALSDLDKYAIIFSINGKKIQVSHDAKAWDKKEETVVAIRDIVAKEIANQILTGLFKGMK
ncbi:MAG: hypothetical protein WAV93_11475 [Bacteroidales bacterium]